MVLLTVAWISIAMAVTCAVVIAADEVRHPQKMGVMNEVWPVTALYFSVFAVWAYVVWGRRKARTGDHLGKPGSPTPEIEHRQEKLTLAQIVVGTSHCGAGCMIADVIAEFGIASASITLLGSVLWAEYAIDFAAAWAVGILFQYFAIRPMRQELSASAAIWAAVKADTLSILAFQVGMYAWMALVFYKLFPAPHLTPFDPRYWLMMQIGMVCGFATALPMNRVLIMAGLKEAM